MKRLLIGFLSLMMVFCFVGCSEEESNEKSEAEQTEQTDKVDQNVYYQTCLQTVTDEFLSDVKYSWDTKDYVVTDLENGTVSVYTRVSIGGISEKQSITTVFDANESQDSYYCHYLCVGDNVYIDDGTVE